MEQRINVKVAAKSREAIDISSFELVLPDGGELPKFEAGAHIEIFLPGQTVRQYSLCNDPIERKRYVIGVLRAEDSRGVSRALHDTVQQGDMLEISAPKNHFALAPKASRSVLLAGGIGVTPILGMAETLSRQGADFTLHYACRSMARAAFLQRIETASYAPRANMRFDDVPGQALDLATALANPEPEAHVYICGPEGLLKAARKVAAELGWPLENVHYEYFSSAVEHLDTDGGFEMEIAATGEVIRVGKNQTALAALLECGIDIPCSCEEGVCGMCMTSVVTGTPDHRDKFLTEAERHRNDTFMPCCSRSKSARLVISV